MSGDGEAPPPTTDLRSADVRRDWLETPSALRHWDEIVHLAQARRAHPGGADPSLQ